MIMAFPLQWPLISPRDPMTSILNGFSLKFLTTLFVFLTVFLRFRRRFTSICLFFSCLPNGCEKFSRALVSARERLFLTIWVMAVMFFCDNVRIPTGINHRSFDIPTLGPTILCDEQLQVIPKAYCDNEAFHDVITTTFDKSRFEWCIGRQIWDPGILSIRRREESVRRIGDAKQLWVLAITKKDVISLRCFVGKRCNGWIATIDRFKVKWSFVKRTIAKRDDHSGLKKKTKKEDNRFDNLLACKTYKRKRRFLHLFSWIFFILGLIMFWLYLYALQTNM